MNLYLKVWQISASNHQVIWWNGQTQGVLDTALSTFSPTDDDEGSLDMIHTKTPTGRTLWKPKKLTEAEQLAINHQLLIRGENPEFSAVNGLPRPQNFTNHNIEKYWDKCLVWVFPDGTWAAMNLPLPVPELWSMEEEKKPRPIQVHKHGSLEFVEARCLSIEKIRENSDIRYRLDEAALMSVHYVPGRAGHANPPPTIQEEEVLTGTIFSSKTKSKPRTPSEYALQKASIAWCYPETKTIPINDDLAKAFAWILDQEMKRVRKSINGKKKVYAAVGKVPLPEHFKLAEEQGITLVPVGERDSFCISADEFIGTYDGVIVSHPVAALRLIRHIPVGVFENGAKPGKSSFVPKELHLFDKTQP